MEKINIYKSSSLNKHSNLNLKERSRKLLGMLFLLLAVFFGALCLCSCAALRQAPSASAKEASPQLPSQQAAAEAMAVVLKGRYAFAAQAFLLPGLSEPGRGGGFLSAWERDKDGLIKRKQVFQESLAEALRGQGAMICSSSELCSGVSLELEYLSLDDGLYFISLDSINERLSQTYRETAAGLVPLSLISVEVKDGN